MPTKSKKRKFSPRKFTDAMAKTLARIHIEGGPTGPDQYEREKKACIMEATSVILGHPWGYNPPCVSEAITNAMICVNDNTKSDRSRAKLKKFVPKIIGTSPTKTATQHGITITTRDTTDPAYQAAEGRRRRYLAADSDLKLKSDFGGDKYTPTRSDLLELVDVPMTKKLKVIEGLIKA